MVGFNPYTNPPDIFVEIAVARHYKEWSDKQIAEEYGFNVKTVFNVRKRMGFKREKYITRRVYLPMTNEANILLAWYRAPFIKAAWDKAKRYNSFGLRAPNKCLARAINHRKLTEKQALKILSLKGKMSVRDIAKKFKVTSGCISAILSGRNFKHLHLKVINNDPINF